MGINYFEKLPQEIKEMIFINLNLSDLLNLCLSSKRLNEAVGQSKCCMQKIWIKFYSFNFNLKELEGLSESARCFEKLKVNRISRDDHFQLLIQLQKRWKKVLIYNCEFKKFSTFYELIKSLSDFIEELEISDIEILSYENDVQYEVLKFPSLKRFMFRNMPLRATEIFLTSSKKLEIAAFDIVQLTESSSLHEITHAILNASSILRHLHLGPQYIKSLFEDENKCYQFPFKLNNLLLKFPIVNDLSEVADENISSFLTHQSKIQWMILMELQNDKILSAAWNDRSLRRMSFIGLEELFSNDMVFDIIINSNLFQLDFISRKVLISQLRKFLKAAPHLKTIHFKNLNRHTMEFIAKNHFNIDTLFYEHIDEEVAEIYQILKKSCENDVNQNIKLVQKSFWFGDNNPFSLDPYFWRL